MVIPFGLTNVLALEQELINNIFRDILDEYIIIYLDDTLVYSSRALDNYIKKVHKVLRRFNEKNLRFKLEKCRFYQEEIEFLKHVIGRNRVYINPQKVALVKEWLKPANITEVQLFLGFINFNRQFIKNYSAIAEPMTRLIKKDQPFCWMKE